MFWFKRNNMNGIDLLVSKQKQFISILMELSQILTNSGNNAQSEFIAELVDIISANNYTLFVQEINSVAMWGGAGAVWEVYIQDIDESDKFNKAMLRIILLMEEVNILGKGIKPLKKFFKSNNKGWGC